MNLADIETSAWAHLEEAVTNADLAFRYLTLCSVDRFQQPQARTVVLRQADPLHRMLEFHTDIRSPKWSEFSDNPKASVLGYCPQNRTQLRFSGVVELFGPETERTAATWDSLSHWTRTTYQGGPPGEGLPNPDMPETVGGEPASQEPGNMRFGVLSFSVRSLDWVQLSRQNNRRAAFDYEGNGACSAMRWLTP